MTAKLVWNILKLLLWCFDILKVQQEKDYRLPYRNYGNDFGHVKKRLSDIHIESVLAKLSSNDSTKSNLSLI